jgi:hypothetical protein
LSSPQPKATQDKKPKATPKGRAPSAKRSKAAPKRARKTEIDKMSDAELERHFKGGERYSKQMKKRGVARAPKTGGRGGS